MKKALQFVLCIYSPTVSGILPSVDTLILVELHRVLKSVDYRFCDKCESCLAELKERTQEIKWKENETNDTEEKNC